MIGAVLGALTSRVAGPIATAVALGLAVLLTVQTVRLHDARTELKAAGQMQRDTDRDLWTCSGNASALKADVKRQNAAVGALKAESDARIAGAEQVAQAARRSTLEAEAASARIKGRPPVGFDVCQRVLSADETFLDAIR